MSEETANGRKGTLEEKRKEKKRRRKQELEVGRRKVATRIEKRKRIPPEKIRNIHTYTYKGRLAPIRKSQQYQIKQKTKKKANYN